MPNRTSLAISQGSIFDSAAESQRVIAQTRERGRWWILSGWVITMVGAFFYCRLLFAMDGECDMPELLHRTGVTGWAALLLMVVGVAFWLAGNLVFLKDALNSTECEPDGTPKNQGTL
ncbi:MAG TPA: hypothetical protein VJ486_04285 [Geothrix sp.]|nr:hypothetical protein [Geothrix sp.]